MKTNLLRGHRNHIKNGIFATAIILFTGLYNMAGAQTIDIGPNQYAFQFTGNPNFGLFFNSTNSQYEFRNGSASPIFAIGAGAGEMRSNLSFGSGSDLLIGNNRYAFRSSSNPNYGLFFSASSSEYQFLDNVGSPVININANTGQLVSASSIVASGGNSAQWTSAFNWGDHATAGYISSEVDPQVGAMSTSRVPRWNGASLVNGSITDAGSGITVAGNSIFNNGLRVLGGANSLVNSTALKVGNDLFFTAIDNNEIQAYANGDQGVLYLNFWGGDITLANNTMWVDREDGRVGVNTSAPTAKLNVEGTTFSTENIIDAQGNYTGGNSDVRAVNADAVISPGFGYGVDASGGYRGVYGFGNGSTYTGTTTGVYGTASGSAGTRIGVYGSAFGGTTNWAMFAQGDSYVSGDLRIGLQSEVPGYRLSVDGRVICEEMRVLISGSWPDYVFNDDYSLMNLNEVEDFIEENNHLPGMPAASEIDGGQGIDLGEMQRLTVEKVEELTLYLIEANKKMDELAKQNEALRQEINELKND